MGLRFHVHANIHALGSDTAARLESIGFQSDPFEYLPSSYAPPIHFSFETNSPQDARAAWIHAVEIIDQDHSFKGYLESETLADAFESIAELERQYAPISAFPLGKLELAPVPFDRHKRSDLHVKRSATTAQDELDQLLLAAGFYEVRTQRNRIYTLQCEDVRDARKIFQLLRQHIMESGGARIVNFEIVGKFYRKPKTFEVVKYLPRQPASFLDKLI